MQSSRAFTVFLAFILLVARFGAAQDTKPAPPSPELTAAIERYLGEADDAKAEKSLAEILAQADLSGEAVKAALAASNTPITERMTVLVPYRGKLLQTTVITPKDHSRTSAPLPVIFEIGAGEGNLEAMGLGRVIRAFVAGYTPPEFSDEGRDGFLKVLRTVVHVANGDPDRLWLTGFSWAGHASFDTAMHRPGSVSGIAPLGGGPRRQHFRLMKHLERVTVLSFCGEKDDPELVWNVREVGHLAPAFKIPATVTIVPNAGHSLPLAGMEAIGPVIDRGAPADQSLRKEGSILADMPHVESPYLRFDQIDEARTKPPARVSVTAGTPPDEQRRTIIRSMEAKVAKITWKIDEKKGEKTLNLSADAAKKGTVFLRAPAFVLGVKWTIRAGGKSAYSDVLTPDPKSMLLDARRTGNRTRPALRTVAVGF